MPLTQNVVISYLHNTQCVLDLYPQDEDDHEPNVVDLARRLQGDGVDCRVERFNEIAPERLCERLMSQFEWADHVVLVCAESYHREFLGRVPGMLLSETNMALSDLFANAENRRFVTVGFVPLNQNPFVPPILRRLPYYDLGASDSFDALCSLLCAPQKVRPEPLRRLGSPVSLFMTPCDRNPFFTGREREIAQLHQMLVGTGAPGTTAAIVGPSGVGKSQLAIEYAFRYRSAYSAVLWCQADTSDRLQSGFIEIARRLNLPEKDAAEQSKVVRAVRKWLETEADYLLVLDNAADPALFRQDDTRDSSEAIFPIRPSGHILRISQAHAADLQEEVNRIALDVFSEQEGLGFLLQRTGRVLVNAHERESARELIEQLGRLPLALEQAGAYLATHPATRFGDYLNEYRSLQNDLRQTHGPVEGEVTKIVRTTTTINQRAAQQQEPAIADILNVCAFLHPDRIPVEIFIEEPDEPGVERDRVLRPYGDPAALHAMLDSLARYGLIRTNARDETFSLRPIVQQVVREQLRQLEQSKVLERVVNALVACYPGQEIGAWPACERLRAHWLTVLGSLTPGQRVTTQAATLLRQAAYYQIERAENSAAEYLYRLGLSDFEQEMRPEHSDTAPILRQLGWICYHQRRFAEAESLLKRDLAIQMKSFGDEHASTAYSRHLLGMLYQGQGHYRDAELWYEEALAVRRRILGNAHLDTARSRNNLGEIYQSLGRYEEAEPLQQAAHSVFEQELGEDHSETIRSLYNLALLHGSQKRFAEAEALHERVLTLRRKVFGEEDPETARSLTSLATLYDEQERYAEAEPLYEQALSIRRKALGADSPDTADTLARLAGLHRSQSRNEAAEPLYKDALRIREKVLGSDHLHTAVSLYSLGVLYYSLGRYVEAEPLLQRCLALAERNLGAEHAETARRANSLGLLYAIQGRYGEAEPLLERALEISERTPGKEHPNIESMRANLRLMKQKQIAEETRPPGFTSRLMHVLKREKTKR